MKVSIFLLLIFFVQELYSQDIDWRVIEQVSDLIQNREEIISFDL